MYNKYLINDICDVGSSKRIYLSEYQNNGIPFYRGKEIIEKESNKEISNELYISYEKYNEIKEKFGVPKNGDILMTAVGTIGISWLVNESKFYFKDGNLIWFKNFKEDKVNNKYLYYTFKSEKFKKILKNISIGSTQKAITIEQIKKIEWFFPKINIQNKIVQILEKIDNKIKLNNQINDNLYEIISQLYKQLFNSGEWKKIELNNIANIFSGKRPKDKIDKGKYPIIGANGVMGYTSGYNLNNDIIIIGRVGSLGAVKRYYREIWASDNTLIIETKYANFVENYLKTVDYISMNRGSTQPLITQSDLKKQKLLFNKDIVEFFESKVKKIVEIIRNNEDENIILSQLRDTLLPKLMNEEIDLENVEI